MTYHPRIENKELGSFLTTRSRNSELWFINNHDLEQAILGYAAKFSLRYGAKLYGLAIEGNHIHSPALFPNGNRAAFMRDFNSNVARAVPRHSPEYAGGKFWAKRYSSEFLPGNDDVEEYFFYTALQPIKDGLVEKISEYPGYHFFHDAVYGIERKFKVVRWGEYNSTKRYNPSISVKSFTDVVKLKYERLPGYEHLAQNDYAKLMYEKFEQRRLAIVRDRRARGLGFAGRDQMRSMKRGSSPQRTKTSHMQSHRPRVLSVCPRRRAECTAWYFSTYFEYREASARFRAGDLNTRFPDGTYRPWTPYKLPPDHLKLAA